MTDELGRGQYLDASLDFDISNTGDIRATQDGTSELQKDLAFQLVIVLGDFQGQRLTPELKSRIKGTTVDVILSDSRVRDVDRGSITASQTSRNSVRIGAPVFTRNGRQELVFEI